MLTALDHIVAATLAGARGRAYDLLTREEFLAEYEEFLRLIAERRRAHAELRANLSEPTVAFETPAGDAVALHIPCSI